MIKNNYHFSKLSTKIKTRKLVALMLHLFQSFLSYSNTWVVVVNLVNASITDLGDVGSPLTVIMRS